MVWQRSDSFGRQRGMVPGQNSGVGGTGRAAVDERHPHQFGFTLPRARPQAVVLGL